MNKQFAIFAWRGDGRYHLRDCIGARVYKRESTANKQADINNNDSTMIAVNPEGYVVRSMFFSDGVMVAPNGRAYCE